MWRCWEDFFVDVLGFLLTALAVGVVLYVFFALWVVEA